MALLLVFTCGYLVGGASALVLLGLTIAARDGDCGAAYQSQAAPVKDRTIVP